MKSQIELILEQQKPQDGFLKELLSTIGVHIEGTLTWGAGITAFYGPVKDLLLNQDPRFTEVEIAMVFIASIALVLKDNSDEIKKLINIVKEKGLEPSVNKSVNFLKTIEDIGIKVAETSGFVVSNLLDIASFTFMFLPIIDAIRAYINSEHLTMDVAPQYFKALLFSIGILSIKNLFNRLVSRLRDLRLRSKPKDSPPPDNLTEGVFTSDFIDYMNADVFDEELEEGELVLEQDETKEDIDDVLVAFNIIDAKFRDELKIWLEEYLNSQKRWLDIDDFKASKSDVRVLEENIEFAMSKVRWIIDEIIQIFKLYGLVYGNQYTTWVWDKREVSRISGEVEKYYVPDDPEITIPVTLISWLKDLLGDEIDPAWEEWSFMIPNANVDRYGRGSEVYG